jgi:hypothetical protein
MLMKKTLIICMALACFVCPSFLPSIAHSVNFATAAKPDQGYQFKLFPFFYTAGTRTDMDGKPVVADLGLYKYGVMIGISTKSVTFT